MSRPISVLSPYIGRLIAAIVICLFYFLARLPQLSAGERFQLADSFRFSGSVLSEYYADNTTPFATVRSVHPDLERISAWISSVGASVALNDLDNDGLSNDVCYVEVRTDQVIIAPAPNTPQRYKSFALNPTSDLYNPATMAPMGCLPNDLNEDGFTDILVYYWGRTPIAFLRTNIEESTPESASKIASDHYYPQEVVSGGERWFTNAATFADLDGDGHADLVIGNYFQDDAEILDANAQTPAYMQHSMSRALNVGRNRLLLWSGATTGAKPSIRFTDASNALDDDVAHGWTLALGAADLDGDLLPELYFANDFGSDRLLHNRSEPGALNFTRLTGQRTFTTPRSRVLGQDSFKGMGTDFGDVNGDGLLDIYVSNIAGEYSLEESHFLYVSTGETEEMWHGIAPYVDRGEALGVSRSSWGWDSRLADFNNDGVLEAVQATGFVQGRVNRWPELHELAMGNDELLRHPQSWPNFQPGDDLSGDAHNPFYVQAADGRYYDIAAEIGLDTPQVTRGIATADVDGDGDLDFAVANQWDTSRFYTNECPGCGAFLGLHLLLPVNSERASTLIRYAGHPTPSLSGRPAIGATIIVHHPDGRRLTAQVDGGNGHSGARSPDLHIGLGDVEPDSRLRVDLHWRDANGQIHQETQWLTPGWHTVLLGNS